MIIIDANVTYQFTKGTAEARLISCWLNQKGLLATGGKNLRELLKTKIRQFIIELERRGRAKRFDESWLKIAETNLDIGIITSDDHHILAMAIVSGCRILFTNDDALIKDFKNTKLITPKGKIFRNAKLHRALLR